MTHRHGFTLMELLVKESRPVGTNPVCETSTQPSGRSSGWDIESRPFRTQESGTDTNVLHPSSMHLVAWIAPQ